MRITRVDSFPSCISLLSSQPPKHTPLVLPRRSNLAISQNHFRNSSGPPHRPAHWLHSQSTFSAKGTHLAARPASAALRKLPKFVLSDSLGMGTPALSLKSYQARPSATGGASARAEFLALEKLQCNLRGRGRENPMIGGSSPITVPGVTLILRRLRNNRFPLSPRSGFRRGLRNRRRDRPGDQPPLLLPPQPELVP